MCNLIKNKVQNHELLYNILNHGNVLKNFKWGIVLVKKFQRRDCWMKNFRNQNLYQYFISKWHFHIARRRSHFKYPYFCLWVRAPRGTHVLEGERRKVKVRLLISPHILPILLLPVTTTLKLNKLNLKNVKLYSIWLVYLLINKRF